MVRRLAAAASATVRLPSLRKVPLEAPSTSVRPPAPLTLSVPWFRSVAPPEPRLMPPALQVDAPAIVRLRAPVKLLVAVPESDAPEMAVTRPLPAREPRDQEMSRRADRSSQTTSQQQQNR